MTEWLDISPYADLFLVFSIFTGIIVFVIANVNYLPDEESDNEGD